MLFSIILLVALCLGAYEGYKKAREFIWSKHKGLEYTRLILSVLGFNILLPLGAIALALAFTVGFASALAGLETLVLLVGGLFGIWAGGWSLAWTFCYMTFMAQDTFKSGRKGE